MALAVVLALAEAAFFMIQRDKPGEAVAPPAAANGPAATNHTSAALAGASALPDSEWDPKTSRRVAEPALRLGANNIVTCQNGRQTTGMKLPTGDFRLVSLSFPAAGTTAKLTPKDFLPPLDAAEMEGLTLQSGSRILSEDVCRPPMRRKL